MIEPKLNIKHLQIAVFDWDNTLAESRTALLFAISRVLQEYKLPEWDVVKNLRDANLSFKDNFPKIFGEKAEEAYRKYADIYLKNVSGLIKSFPKVREVLDFFTEHNIPIMIMTNKDRKLLEYELPLLFKPQTFANIVCGHEAKADKPHKEHLLYTVKNIIGADKITPQKVWVIGDSPQDSTCAKQAGALPIRIGKAIWADNDDDREGILFFDSFVDFYQTLLLSNPK